MFDWAPFKEQVPGLDINLLEDGILNPSLARRYVLFRHVVSFRVVDGYMCGLGVTTEMGFVLVEIRNSILRPDLPDKLKGVVKDAHVASGVAATAHPFIRAQMV